MIDLVVLEGKSGSPGDIESMVRKVRIAAIYDNLKKFCDCPYVGKKILATNDRELVDFVSEFGCETHFFDSNKGFHFGEMFTEIVNRFNLSRVFYLGGGAGLFLTPGEIEEICRGVSAGTGVFYTNNFFSSDFVAFSPASVVNEFAMPRHDNLLAYLLQEEAGLTNIPLKPSLGTVFDIDTPTDLHILGMCSFPGAKTEEALKKLDLPLDSIQKMRAIFTNMDAELLVYGRINSTIFSHLESHLKCRLRIYSEERGMKARGRIERGEVVSLPGIFIQEAGIEKFLSSISSFCNGAFIDSRIIFAHLRKKVSKEERYLSDFGLYEDIKDEFVREFTRCCKQSAIPIVLGGHSLISGGLWVLAEILTKESHLGDQNSREFRVSNLRRE